MHFFGFIDFKDFINTIFGSETLITKVLLSGLIVGISLIAGVEKFIWSPFWTLIFYIIVLTADFVAGTILGMRREGFQTAKAQRLPAILVTHLFLLGSFHNLPKLNNALGVAAIDPFFLTFSHIFYWYVLLVNLASFVRNAAALGWIKGKIAHWIIDNIDKHKPK